MDWWMILLICLAAFIFLALAAFLTASYIMLNRTLTARKGISPERQAELNAQYGSDPQWFENKPKKLWRMQSFDKLSLAAVYIEKPDSTGKVAIIQHGFKSDPFGVGGQAQIFYEQGYSLLLPYARAHGESEGRYIGMGWFDRFDLRRWIDVVIEALGAQTQIVIAGVSMGAAAALGVAGQKLPKNVKCVISDSAYSSLDRLYRHRLKDGKIPYSLVMLLFNFGCKLFMGYSVYSADFCALLKSASVPVLFIHGGQDAAVPPDMCTQLYEACTSSVKRTEIFEGAKHAQCITSERDRYQKAVMDFIEGLK